MSSIHRLGWPILLLLVASSASADEAENWERLRSMPRQQRQALSEKLQQFDRLPQAERQAIRSLDERIAQSDNREEYRSVLRRYHLWLESLTEEQRSELRQTPPDQRLSVIQRILAKQPIADSKPPRSLFLQLADYGGTSPFELGSRLQVWFALPPHERAEYDKLAGKPWRDKMGQRGSELKIKPVPRPSEVDEEKLFKQLRAKALERADLSQFLNRLEENSATKDQEKVKFKAQARDRRLHLAENYYFLLHQPAAVSGPNLLAFESALPTWIRRLYDHLPPEEARRRLSVLYRLVFPAPKEITSAGAAASSGTPNKAPASEPASQPPAPASPPKPAATPF